MVFRLVIFLLNRGSSALLKNSNDSDDKERCDSIHGVEHQMSLVGVCLPLNLVITSSHLTCTPLERQVVNQTSERS